MIRPSHFTATLSLAFTLCSCDKAPEPKAGQAAAAPKAEAKTPAAQPVTTKPAAPQPAANKPVADSTPPKEMEFPEAVDIGGFGNSEPVERKDMPTRGIITFGPKDYEHSNGTHWETYTWTKFKAKRSGRYQVRLTYTLLRAALGMQFRMGDLMVKKTLASASQPTKSYLGTVSIAQPGDMPFALLTPPAENAGLSIQEIALIPTSEGDEIKQAEDGVITLNAKDATTWSETMRYESKPEKNCLGYWTEPDDFAEWEFQVIKPGRYKVAVSHGCGGGNHGSEVEVKLNGQALKFTTQDTGGFQKWQDVQAGEIEIKAAGTQRLVIDPVNKLKAAVLDVQKVVLTPVR